MIETSLLRSLLDYDPETGIALWKRRDIEFFSDAKACAIWNGKWAGKPAGSVRHPGYICVTIFNKHYYLHRLAWQYVYGEVPVNIDHIDGDRGNNRIANLRNVDVRTNSRNASISPRNTLGVMGVRFRHGKYQACISLGDRKQKHLGSFDTLEEASAAHKAAAEELGYHPNHGERPSVR